MIPTAPFGKEEIERILPHRDPFLLLDEVIELDPGKKVVATRLVRAEDWWFPGHFPERPVMPGVLIVEAMAQSCAVLSFKSLDIMPKANSIFYFRIIGMFVPGRRHFYITPNSFSCTRVSLN